MTTTTLPPVAPAKPRVTSKRLAMTVICAECSDVDEAPRPLPLMEAHLAETGHRRYWTVETRKGEWVFPPPAEDLTGSGPVERGTAAAAPGDPDGPGQDGLSRPGMGAQGDEPATGPILPRANPGPGQPPDEDLTNQLKRRSGLDSSTKDHPCECDGPFDGAPGFDHRDWCPAYASTARQETGHAEAPTNPIPAICPAAPDPSRPHLEAPGVPARPPASAAWARARQRWQRDQGGDPYAPRVPGPQAVVGAAVPAGRVGLVGPAGDRQDGTAAAHGWCTRCGSPAVLCRCQLGVLRAERRAGSYQPRHGRPGRSEAPTRGDDQGWVPGHRGLDDPAGGHSLRSDSLSPRHDGETPARATARGAILVNTRIAAHLDGMGWQEGRDFLIDPDLPDADVLDLIDEWPATREAMAEHFGSDTSLWPDDERASRLRVIGWWLAGAWGWVLRGWDRLVRWLLRDRDDDPPRGGESRGGSVVQQDDQQNEDAGLREIRADGTHQHAGMRRGESGFGAAATPHKSLAAYPPESAPRPAEVSSSILPVTHMGRDWQPREITPPANRRTRSTIWLSAPETA